MNVIPLSTPPMPTRTRSVSYRARRIHRWLGLFVGVQFLLWTVGGLYFSWTSLDAVHGDHLMRPQPQLRSGVGIVSPSVVLERLGADRRVDSLAGATLTTVLERPTWRIDYFTVADGRPARRRVLADATTGELRAPLTRDEAVAAARASYTGTDSVIHIEYLTAANVGRHHEYREQPLPAWAVRFAGEERPTAYVDAEIGQVIRIRNDRWRAFDFLWMLHTMDYQGRDNFNNFVLRAFSVLGLVTVLSGMTLFVLTSRWVVSRRRQATRATADASSLAAALARTPHP